MTFASFIPILLYAPYALYRQGYGAFYPHEDWGKSRAEITAKGKFNFDSILSRLPKLNLKKIRHL